MKTLNLLWILTALAILATPAASRADEADAKDWENMAEGDIWPIGMRLSDEMVGERTARRQNRPADVLIWTPPGVERIRAIVYVPNNTDSKIFLEHEELRRVLTRHKVGIVYMRAYFTGIEYHHRQPVETPPQAPENPLKLLKLIAERLDQPEFEHAPWVTLGKSSRGEFPFRMGWIYPERTIAGITWHGETPTWPIPAYAAKQDQSILYLAVNGQEEWDGTWYRHVRPSMLNYRATNAWLPHQAVSHGVGHGNYVDMHGSAGWGKPVPEGRMSVLRMWDYMSLFVDKALELRLPEEGYPTEKPLKLRQIDPNTGYLVHPRAVEETIGMRWKAFRHVDGQYRNIPWPDERHPVIDTEQGTVKPELLIRPAKGVPEDERRKHFWIADRQMVEAWLDLHNLKELEIPLPADDDKDARAE
ncbi:MAG: hypothetical protein JJU36_10855 [Phycisphaeraceae bacterium]|nr:hypothetical protein [Phycisphaeraceae bacterium]